MPFGGYDGSIRIDSRIDAKGFNKGIDGLVSGLAKVGAAIATAFAVKKIFDFTQNVAKLSAEFQRLGIAAQAVGQLHGFAAEETRALVEELINSGIQTDIANKAFIEFARNGLDAGLLPALARGAQDLAVFADSGESSSDVLNSLIHGIVTLNPIVLRHAGVIVDLDGAYRKMAAAIGISANELSSQEKQQAALIAVTEKLQGVTGLYELSQKTAAGQLSSNIRIVNEFKAAIGDVFQTAFYKLIKGFNDLIKVMTAAIKPGGQLHDLFVRIGVIAAFVADIITSLFRAIAGLFGVDIGKAKSTASTGGAEETASANKAIGDSADEASKKEEKLAKGLDKANKAARGALASFDQLNVLQKDTAANAADAASGAGAGLDGSILGDLGLIDPSQFENPLAEIEEKLEEFKQKAAEVWANVVEFLQPVIIAFQEHLLPVIKKIGGEVWNGLVWVWENILVPLGTWLIETLLPKLEELAGVVLEDLLIAWEDLKPVLQELWDDYLKPTFEWLGEKLIEGIDWLIEKLKELPTWIENNELAFRIIAIAVGVLALALILLAAGPIALVIGAIVAMIAIIATAKEHFEFLKEVAITVFAGILSKIVEFITGTETEIETMKSVFSAGLDYIKELFQNAFTGIRDFVFGIFDSVASKIADVIQSILDAINTAIERIQNIKLPSFGGFNLPSFSGLGFKPGGSLDPFIEKIKIPGFATGAVIPPNASFLAMLGDQTAGKNVEAPESLIRNIMREELGKIEANIQIEFTGSNSGIARLLLPELKREDVRIGNSLIKSGVVAK